MAKVFELGSSKWATHGSGVIATVLNDKDKLEGTLIGGERDTPKFTKGKDGNLYESTINEPAVSYENTERGALLLEPSTVQINPHSVDLSQFTGGQGETPVPTGEILNGIHQVHRFEFTSADQNKYLFYDAAAYPMGTVVSFSALVKGPAGSSIKFGVLNGSGLHIFSGEWEVIKQEGVVSATNSSIQFNTYSSVSARIFDVAYISVEEGEYVTSFIPTYGEEVARGSDAAYESIDLSKYINTFEGVLEVKVRSKFIKDRKSISLSNGTDSNKIEIRLEDEARGNVIGVSIRTGGESNLHFNESLSVIQEEWNIVKVQWTPKNMKLSLNGVELATNITNYTGFEEFTKLKLNRSQGSFPFYGEIEYIRIYDSNDDY